MKVLPINSFNSNSMSKNSKKENINFGVKLYVEDRVPRFVFREAAGKAYKQGLNAQKVLNETFDVAMSFFGRLTKKVESITPVEMPVCVELTERANRYIDECVIDEDNIDVTGPEFPEEQAAFRIKSPSPFAGYLQKDYPAFRLDEAGLQKFEQEIETFANIYRQYSSID